jgi:hypothetical protein
MMVWDWMVWDWMVWDWVVQDWMVRDWMVRDWMVRGEEELVLRRAQKIVLQKGSWKDVRNSPGIEVHLGMEEDHLEKEDHLGMGEDHLETEREDHNILSTNCFVVLYNSVGVHIREIQHNHEKVAHYNMAPADNVDLHNEKNKF